MLLSLFAFINTEKSSIVGLLGGNGTELMVARVHKVEGVFNDLYFGSIKLPHLELMAIFDLVWSYFINPNWNQKDLAFEENHQKLKPVTKSAPRERS